MRICIISSVASHYREGIYSLFAKRYDCDFFFSKGDTHLKLMDYSVLDNKVKTVKKRSFKSLVYQVGIPSLALSDYQNYIAIGDPHYLSTWGLLLLLKFYPNKKIFLWTHGWYGKEHGLSALFKKWFLKLADGLFLYGNYAKELLIELGLNKEILRVVHNSLNYNRQIEIRATIGQLPIFKDHFNNEYPVIIVIGRLNQRKKLPLLIEACHSLWEQHFYCNIVFVGDGDSRNELEHIVKINKLDECVWFYGECYDEDSNATLIYNSDLCVVPGDIGLTAIHCMTFGVPVITHDMVQYHGPEFEAIKPGATGQFFKYGDTESLAGAIKDWISGHPDREQVRKACQEEVDHFWTPEFQMAVFDNTLRNDLSSQPPIDS